MDNVQWPQGLGLVKPMEDLVSSTTTTLISNTINTNTSCTTTTLRPQVMTAERRTRPQKEQALNCPRCNSTNTKFCYYNNYSLTQPRYFCKTCRRYWTEGGSLRNVPVGGGSRKNKRPPSSSSATPSLSSSVNINSLATTIPINSDSSSAVAEVSVPAMTLNTSNKLHAEHLVPPRDLNLAFNLPSIPEFGDSSISSSSNSLGAFAPMQIPIIQDYSQNNALAFGFSTEFRAPASALVFPGDYASLQVLQERSKMLFPFAQLKPAVNTGTSSSDGNEGQLSHDHQNTPGFWNNGMINGSEGSW